MRDAVARGRGRCRDDSFDRVPARRSALPDRRRYGDRVRRPGRVGGPVQRAPAYRDWFDCRRHHFPDINRPPARPVPRVVRHRAGVSADAARDRRDVGARCDTGARKAIFFFFFFFFMLASTRSVTYLGAAVRACRGPRPVPRRCRGAVHRGRCRCRGRGSRGRATRRAASRPRAADPRAGNPRRDPCN